MCSSPKGSSESEVNNPRIGGVLASMDSSSRAKYTAIANAADNRRTQQLAISQQANQAASQHDGTVLTTTKLVSQIT